MRITQLFRQLPNLGRAVHRSEQPKARPFARLHLRTTLGCGEHVGDRAAKSREGRARSSCFRRAIVDAESRKRVNDGSGCEKVFHRKSTAAVRSSRTGRDDGDSHAVTLGDLAREYPVSDSSAVAEVPRNDHHRGCRCSESGDGRRGPIPHDIDPHDDIRGAGSFPRAIGTPIESHLIAILSLMGIHAPRLSEATCYTETTCEHNLPCSLRRRTHHRPYRA